MCVYVSMILLSVIIAVGIEKYTKENNQKLAKIYKIFAFLPAFLVMGFRYGIGQDYFFTYKPIFEDVLRYGEYNNVEFGYVILNKIVQIFTKDYAGIFVVTAFLFCYFIFKAIYQESENVPLSIYILFTSCFYFYAMNAVRQTIVIAIFMCSLKFIKNRQFKKYMTSMLLAACIHKIALIFIPIYFIGNIKISFKKFIVLTVIMIACIPIINTIIPKLLAGGKYENYLNGKYVVSENTSMISPIINLGVLGMCFYYTYKEKKRNLEDKSLNIYKNIHIIGFFASLFLGKIPLVSRIFVNFYHMQILTIPLLFKKEKRANIRAIIALICVICFAILFIYSVGILNGNKVLPYKTIFDR